MSVNNQSWFQKLKGSISGVIFGFVLFLLSFYILFDNEKNFIEIAKSLDEGANITISIGGDKLKKENDSKLVHVVGFAKTEEKLTDNIFGVQKNAIKMRRLAQIYQWIENEKTEKEKTRYTYEKKWVNDKINFSSFKGGGPKDGSSNNDPYNFENYKKGEFVSENIVIGDFYLSDSLIDKINFYEKFSLNESDFIEKINDEKKEIIEDNSFIIKYSGQLINNDETKSIRFSIWNQKEINCENLACDSETDKSNLAPSKNKTLWSEIHNSVDIKNGKYNVDLKFMKKIDLDKDVYLQIEIKKNDVWEVIDNDEDLTNSKLVREKFDFDFEKIETETNKQNKSWKLDNGIIYFGNPKNPNIGDIKIEYEIIKTPKEISLISKQKGDSFEKYISEKGGRAVEILEQGIKTKEEMFTNAHSSNKFTTWMIRIAGFLMMYFGIFLIMRPISVLVDFIPFLGSILKFGISIVAFLISFPLSIFTIAFGWIFYRPLFAVGLILISGLIWFFVFKKTKDVIKKKDIKQKK